VAPLGGRTQQPAQNAKPGCRPSWGVKFAYDYLFHRLGACKAKCSLFELEA